MNRRAFCLALAAAACGGVERPRRRRRTPAPPPPAARGYTCINRGDPYTYRRWRSAIAFHGDRLVHSSRDELQLWDSLAMVRACVYPLPHHSCCFLPDGSLVALDHGDYDLRPVVHWIDPAGAVRSFAGPRIRKASHVLPTATPGEVYAMLPDEVVVLARVGGSVWRTASHRLPRGVHDPYARSASLGAGRVLVPGDRLTVAHRDGTTHSAPAPANSLVHLAPASADRCWYTLTPAPYAPIAHLVLASIAAPDVPLQRVAFADSHVIDLAAHDNAAAVLLMVVDMAAASFDAAVSYAIAVISDDGRERWRAELPPAHTAHRELALNTRGCLAMSARRVVLRGLDDALLAWDAASGQRIPG